MRGEVGFSNDLRGRVAHALNPYNKKETRALKTITLLAVMAALLFDLFGTKSSVGGPMTDLLIGFLTMWSVGIYEAWSEKRGPLGWALSVFVAFIGGFIGISLFGMMLEKIMTLVHFEGQLASSDHPLRYVATVGMPVFTVLGAWLPLKIISRLR